MELIYAIIIALFLLMEGFSRLLIKKINKISKFAVGVEAAEHIASKSKFYSQQKNPVNLQKLFEPRPYGLYWNSPNFHQNGIQQTDSNGFRYKGYNVSHEKNGLRVLVYGGSTTFSNHFIDDPSKCWPHLVEKLINQKLPRKAEFINAGLNWATSAELLSHFIFEGKKFLPDMLIIEGPGNDALPISLGDFTPDYRETRGAISWQVRKYEAFWLNHFKMIKLFYIFWLRNQNVLNLRADKYLSRDIRNTLLINNHPYSYENNIDTFIEQALFLNIKIVLIDFSVNYFIIEDDKPGISDGLSIHYKKMNDILENAAKKNPEMVKYISIDNNLFTQDDFADAVHLNENGEIKKAKYLSDLLLPIFTLKR
jgi:hypothetical protein